jgi:hypothetical protein
MCALCDTLAGHGRRWLLIVGIGLAVAGFSGGVAVRLFAQRTEDEFKPVRAVPAQPPLTDFPTKNVGDAAKALNPAELVLGVTVGDESRAYPINMLTGPQREILNDTLGGEAIAATW